MSSYVLPLITERKNNKAVMSEKWVTEIIFEVKLPGHPVRTGQARRGFPGT
jgi:hypothetical protein